MASIVKPARPHRVEPRVKTRRPRARPDNAHTPAEAASAVGRAKGVVPCDRARDNGHQTQDRLGDGDSAALIYERLQPWCREVDMIPSMADSCVAHYLGALSATLGDHARARTHLDEALAIHSALRAPFHVARTQVALARVVLAENGSDSPRCAEKLLTEAVSTARQRGYEGIRQECESLMPV